MCVDCPEEESAEHFLIHYRKYQTERRELKESLIDKNIHDFSLLNLSFNPATRIDVEKFISSIQNFKFFIENRRDIVVKAGKWIFSLYLFTMYSFS